MKRVTLWFGAFLGLALVIVGAVPVAGQHVQPGEPSGLPDGSSVADWQSIQDQVAKLVAAEGAAEDNLGYSVSLSGDVAVVGAYHSNVDGKSEQGAGYIFYRDQGGPGAWGQVARLTASDGVAGDNFGFSVVVDGDTVLVGAPFATDKGAAYVFYRNQGGPDGWGQVARLLAAEGEASDQFGCSVALDGDTAVVGALWAGVYYGAAYVFYRNQGGPDGWGQVARLSGAPHLYDHFGNSVSVDGNTVVVGAADADNAGDDMGAAYVFYRDWGGPDAWGQVIKLSGAGWWFSGFGSSVSVSGDTLVVGENQVLYAGHGAAYVFYRNQGGADAWGLVKTLTAGDGNTWAFGQSVSLDGDALVVGAPDSDVGTNGYQGAAYGFRRDEGGPDAWGPVAHLLSADGAAHDRFGWAVSANDGFAVVGAAWAAIDGKVNQGAAYVYDLPGSKLLHLNHVRLTARAGSRPGTYVVKAVTTVHNQADAAAPDVTVDALWTLPSGRTSPKEAATDLKGRARFNLHVRLAGTYQFCVTDLVKAGYAYNPGANETPACQSVVVGP